MFLLKCLDIRQYKFIRLRLTDGSAVGKAWYLETESFSNSDDLNLLHYHFRCNNSLKFVLRCKKVDYYELPFVHEDIDCCSIHCCSIPGKPTALCGC